MGGRVEEDDVVPFQTIVELRFAGDNAAWVAAAHRDRDRHALASSAPISILYYDNVREALIKALGD